MVRNRLISLIIAVAILGFGCTSRSEDAGWGNDKWGADITNPVNATIPSNVRSASDDLERWAHLMRRYNSMRDEIRLYSRKYGIADLSGGKTDSESEIRIWLGFGMALPTCFILRGTTEKQNALYIHYLDPSDFDSGATTGSNLRAKTALGTPTSGWDRLEVFLKDEGIDYPIKLAMDEDALPIPDGTFIAIEVRRGTAYDMVYYSSETKSRDGKRAIKICERAAQEFNVDKRCRY